MSKIKTFWKRYGLAITAGALLLLSAFVIWQTFYKKAPPPLKFEDRPEFQQEKKRADSLQQLYNRGRDSISMLMGQVEDMLQRESYYQHQNSNLEKRLYENNNRVTPLPNYSASEVAKYAETKYGDDNVTP